MIFLVDTGANVTILSKQFIDKMKPALSHKIEPVNISLITATGESSPFIGQIQVEICLGENKYSHNVLVADIPNEGILGMDFLTSHGCDVILSKNRLVVGGENIPCFHYASSAKSCYKVVVQETLEVPANSEIIVPGESWGPIFKSSIGLIEPNTNFMERKGLLVARAVVKPDVDNIPVRVMNTTDEPCKLYKGTNIATCMKIAETDVQRSEVVKNVHTNSRANNQKKQLPEHLIETYESGKEHLNDEQREKFRDLLIEYGTTFSKSIGRYRVDKFARA